MRGIGIGNRRLSDECNTGKTIAKSLLNYKGINYNGDGMLLGQLNVVNIGLLLLIAEDESRGGGLREKSVHYKPPLLGRFTLNIHTESFSFRGNTGRREKVKAVPFLCCKAVIGMPQGSGRGHDI